MKSVRKAVAPGRVLFPLLLLAAVGAWAATPDFSGNWTLDPSQSQGAPAQAIQLSIQQTADQITFHRTLQEGGRTRQDSFTCAPNGTTCDFDEDGHKAKVTLWYDGPKLVIAKTDGPDKDATTERKMELSTDGKTLTVEFTNYSDGGKPDKLVFKKQ